MAAVIHTRPVRKFESHEFLCLIETSVVAVFLAEIRLGACVQLVLGRELLAFGPI